MQVGTLVRHIEYEYIGVVLKYDYNLSVGEVYWGDSESSDWYTKCELEVLCK